jgi:hypothetical protein
MYAITIRLNVYYMFLSLEEDETKSIDCRQGGRFGII